MKCLSCGAELGLTDEICPYCGRVITETASHRADLKTYKEKTETGKRGLAKVLSGNLPLIISAVMMLVLLIADGVALYVKENAYHFRSDAMRMESVKEYDTYAKTIKEYLDAGDYTGFVAFKDYHRIAEWEPPYEDLNLIWELAYDYENLVSKMESALMYGEQAKRYHEDTDVSDCRREINEFYREFESMQSEIETDPYGTYIFDMKQKADAMLKVYLGLDDAAREDYLNRSDIEQQAYLEGVIIHE